MDKGQTFRDGDDREMGRARRHRHIDGVGLSKGHLFCEGRQAGIRDALPLAMDQAVVVAKEQVADGTMVAEQPRQSPID